MGRVSESVLYFLPPRNLLLAVCTMLALKSIGLGQTPSGTEPKFITRAELVTVPVIVTDKSGAHIHNLAKADFDILEDGKEQKITSLEEIQSSASPIQHFSAHKVSSATDSHRILLRLN